MGKRTISALLLCLLLCGCGLKRPDPQPVETVDPYAGMVQVASGFGTKMWVKEYEALPVNPYLDRTDWAELDTVELRYGIDVSEHQGEIDWDVLLKKNSVDFVILRIGYRGYGTEGQLREDAYFRYNLEAALANDLDIGLYFFSQATTLAEAEEEADFVLGLLEELSLPAGSIALPIFFDWEHIDFDEARTDDMSGDLTDLAIGFCGRIREAGYVPGVYAYRSLAYYSYDLSRLTDYQLWIGALGETPDFYYAHAFWQRAVVTGVDGIEGEVDLNVWFRPLPEPTPTATPDDTQGETEQISAQGTEWTDAEP